tara:strand:- start:24 stop:740 length:717 start_codon:yes stop_codon:yes gene_type:complete
MTSSTNQFRTRKLQVRDDILIGIKNARENYGELSIISQDQQNTFYFKAENDMFLRLNSSFQRTYQQINNVVLDVTGSKDDKGIIVFATQSIVSTLNAIGTPQRLANYARVGSVGELRLAGEFSTNAANGVCTFDFYIGSVNIATTGSLDLPNLVGVSGAWNAVVHFTTIAVGDAKTARVKVDGCFQFSDKTGISNSINFNTENITTFQTTTTETIDIQVTPQNLTAMEVSNVAFFFLG